MKKLPKTFFGWSNIKWAIKELINIYSTRNSFFSKKRLESGMAFVIAQWGMIFFLVQKYSTMSMSDMMMWAGAEFAISGYMLNHIQKEKKKNETPKDPEEGTGEE